jgi:hypothetical protein
MVRMKLQVGYYIVADEVVSRYFLVLRGVAGELPSPMLSLISGLTTCFVVAVFSKTLLPRSSAKLRSASDDRLLPFSPRGFQ